MDILVVGAGVIGTVYGAQLAAGGHSVAVLAHGRRTDHVAHAGLVARDAISGIRLAAPVTIVATASSAPYDLIVVAIRYGQLVPALAGLLGEPTVLYFGNNPIGRPSLPVGLPGKPRFGFPGIGGSLTDGVVEDARIAHSRLRWKPAPHRSSMNSSGPCTGASSRRNGWATWMAGSHTTRCSSPR